ncbi:MAG: ABC transporter permease subunit [Variovorax sp.]
MDNWPGYAGQLVLLALMAWLSWHGISNFIGNARSLGVSMGFGFLQSEAGFQIAQAMIQFSPTSSYGDAIVVATLNSLLVIALSGIISTLIALCVAFGRLSAHPLIRGASTAYVEVFRNIPMLLQILFWYFSALALLPGVSESYELGAVLLNNRGLFLPQATMTPAALWALLVALVVFAVGFFTMRRALWARTRPGILLFCTIALLALCAAPLALMHTQFGVERPAVEGFNVAGGFTLLPELIALTLGLSIYNSAFLAEIFRAGIQSVPGGQAEAAATVGLTGVRAALLIVLPQALRLALPPAAGQYQTLAKASSLAAAIGYPDIMQIVGGTVLSQTNQALEAMTLVVLLYAAINIAIALVMNLANRRLLKAERR